MKGKKILITGGRGFIGSNLADVLSKENEVRIYDIKDGNDVRDLNNLKKAMETVDFVFHFAAQTSVEESMKNPQETMEINLLGIYNVLKAATSKGIVKVIFASSAAVYGDTKNLPIKEGEKLVAKSPYAQSKIVSETLLKSFKEEFGLNSVALRFFNVFGPKQNPNYGGVVSIFISKALKNEDLIIYGDGKQTRDFIYIKDVDEANILAAEKNVSGAFNIGSGKSISVEELAKLIISLTDSKSKVVYEKAKEGEVIDSLADITKAKKILGFEPQYSLEDGLKETIEWFKKYY